MDYESYDNDTNSNDEDYFAFVEWLENRTAAQFIEAKGDPERQRRVLLEYWKRGTRANLGPSELIDFLGVDSPSILDMAGYTEEEGDAIMELSDALTLEEIDQTSLEKTDA